MVYIQFVNILVICQTAKLKPRRYHKRGKIRWAKLSRIPPNAGSFSQENFHGALHLQHLNSAIVQRLLNVHGKTYAVLLKNRDPKMQKFSPVNLSLFMVYHVYVISSLLYKHPHILMINQ